MILANFTPEDITWQHIGISGVLHSSKIMEVDDARGNHIVNKWGKRGIIQLVFGDEKIIDEKKKESYEIWKLFWEHQVIVFNQHNESLKNENKAYVKPTTELQLHADKLGIELIGSWKLKRRTDSAELDSVKSENAGLKSSLETMQEQIADLTNAISGLASDVKIGGVEKDIFYRQFRNLNKARFKIWIKKSTEILAKEWPTEMVKEVKLKWANFYPGESFPDLTVEEEEEDPESEVERVTELDEGYYEKTED